MNEVILSADGLSKRFDNGVLAVDDVNFNVRAGETVGIVGESGCGKSTTGKLLLRLLEPDTGTVHFDGLDLGRISADRMRKIRRDLQLVPQNPQTSLNPRLTIESSIIFNLRAHGWSKRDAKARVAELLDQVGISTTFSRRYPHQLSGGQLQRVAIARALSTEPKLIICDEAVSALDKSVQAQVLNLLVEIQRETNVAYLFISHDLAVVEHLSDRVLVMYLGRIVEEADADALWRSAAHPYSNALLGSIPGSDREHIVLVGDLPSPADPPSGCGFRTRCPEAIDRCAEERPPLVTVAHDHRSACIFSTPAEALVEVTV